MKPDWLVCEKCLWWVKDDESIWNMGYCRHSQNPNWDTAESLKYIKYYYCENWTCRNCWGTWDDGKMKNINTTDEKWIIKNHDKCEPVEMED